MRKILLYMILIFCTIQQSHSQGSLEGGVVALQLPVRNSLRFNQYVINPTFSFVREQNKYISVSNKREWVQFDDAPQTYLVSYSGRFAENTGMGIGLFQQNYGVFTTFGGVVNYAYNAVLNNDNNLTFGINLAFYKSGLNQGKVITNFTDSSLDNIPSNMVVAINPGINYGFEFLDFGVSVNNLVAYNFKTSALIEKNPEQNIQVHIMYTGYMNNRGFFDESKFSTLVRSEFKNDITVISGLIMLTVPKGIWAQAGYNTLYGLSAGLGLNISSQIAIEYNYEKAMGDLSSFGNSHDITLAFKFKNRNRRYDYSGDDKEASLIIPDKSSRRAIAQRNSTTNTTKVDRNAIAEAKAKAREEAVEQARLNAEAKAQARAVMVEEAKVRRDAYAQAQAEAYAANQAKLDAEAQAIAAEEARKLEEAKVAADAQAQIDAANQARLDAEAKANAAEEARKLAEARAKADAQAKIDAANQAKLNAEAQAKAAEEAKKLAEARAKADAKAKLAADAQAKIDAANQAKLDAEAKANAAEEARKLSEARAKADAKAKADAQAKAKADAANQARLDAEAKAKAAEETRKLADAKAKADADAQAKIDAANQARLDAQAKAKAEEEARKLADAKAKADAEAQAKIDAANQSKLDAQAKAKAAEEARKLADAKAKADAEAKAKADAANQARLDAEAKAKAAEEARKIADAKAKANADAQAKIDAANQARLDAEAKTKAAEDARKLADAKAKADAEAKAKADAANQARLDAEAKAKAAADAQAKVDAANQARLDAEAKAKAAEDARKLADAKAKADAEAKAKAERDALAALVPTDATAKSMQSINKATDASKRIEEDLFSRLNESVASREKDLKDLKEENDLSEKGIFKAPKPFKSVSGENAALESLKSEIDNVLKSQETKISELNKLYTERVKEVSDKNDATNAFYLKRIQELKAGQLKAVQSKENLIATLESIKVATEIERKRRIKRAAYDNDQDRYLKDRAVLKQIKQITPKSNVPLKESDFDFGEEQSKNIQIVKGIKNIESGYYLVLAVHTDVAKRDAFLAKVVSLGQTDIDFFYDINTNKYYIFQKKFTNMESAKSAIGSKGAEPYNSKASLVKIEN